VFHNSLLTPYTITPKHGPNYTQPPPTIVEGENEHYEMETVLNARTTLNQHGIQYLVKWKEYLDFKNSWVSATDIKHAMALIKDFHHWHPRFQTTTYRHR
jgi:hypothetical protein